MSDKEPPAGRQLGAIASDEVPPDAGARLVGWWDGQSALFRLVVRLSVSGALVAATLIWRVGRSLGYKTAYNIMIGVASPFGDDRTTWTSTFALALSIVGYLAVPALAGASAALVIGRMLQRSLDAEPPRIDHAITRSRRRRQP